MKINQIAQYINDVYSYTEGNDEITLDNDLRNIVDYGEKITSDSTFNDTFRTKFGDILAKVTSTYIHEQNFNMPIPSVYKDRDSYNNAREHILIDIGDFVDNETYIYDSNTFEKLFGEERPDVSATYYNSTKTYSFKMTITNDMYKDSFTSAEKFSEFWNKVFAMIENKAKFATAILSFATFVSKVCDSVHSNAKNNVVTLSIPNDNNFTNFISTIKSTIRKVKDFNTYSNDGYMDSTPEEHLHLAILGDVWDKMTTSKAYSLNDRFLDIPLSNIDVLNHFSDINNPDSISKIIPENAENCVTNIENIVAVLYDDRGCNVYNTDVTVNSQTIANKKNTTNYFYMYDSNWCVVRAYKCVIFTQNGKSDVTLNKPIV